jgi:hypothetical protein
MEFKVEGRPIEVYKRSSEFILGMDSDNEELRNKRMHRPATLMSISVEVDPKGIIRYYEYDSYTELEERELVRRLRGGLEIIAKTYLFHDCSKKELV